MIHGIETPRAHLPGTDVAASSHDSYGYNIIRTYLGRDMDNEYVIYLCTTIHAKDKVSLFLCYLFTYFENRLLPKNIIIIRNYGDDDGVLKDRHGGGEDQQGTSNPS
jgi:hypothetical protein